MLKRRAELSGSLLFVAAMLGCINCQIEMTGSVENKTGTNESRPRVFSPRMDYDEWTPLGRGDPLKNDPTFDYVPPVLDRVQYWLNSHTTEPSAKRDILVLGVTAKKTSPKIPEQFLKFVDGPKFNRNQEQQHRNEHIVQRNDYPGSTGAEPPKIMRNTNFRNSLIDYRNHNRIQNVPASYYPSPLYNRKAKPYTMMLPPPVVPKPMDSAHPTYAPQKVKVNYGEQNYSQQFSTQTEEGPPQAEHQSHNNVPMTSHSRPHPPPRIQSTSSKSPPPPKNQISQIEAIHNVFAPPAKTTKQKFQSVTTPPISFEKSNLVYHSTEIISGGRLGNEGFAPETNQATWHTPVNSEGNFNTADYHAAASSSQHEVVVGQNANIIVDDGNVEDEEVVVGKKEPAAQDTIVGPTPVPPTNIAQSPMFSTGDHDSGGIVGGRPPISSSSSSNIEMQIVVANTGPTSTDRDNLKPEEPVAVVMPANYADEMNVTNGDLKIDGTNITLDDKPDMLTSVIEQTIQISNPISASNFVTNLPIFSPQINQISQMNHIFNQNNQMNKIPYQSNPINPMNTMNTINPMNPMNQIIQMNQMDQMHRFSARPLSAPSNALPLIQHNSNSGHTMMSHTSDAIMRHPLGGISPMHQQMFTGQIRHSTEELPNSMDRNPAMVSMPNGAHTPTIPHVELTRDDAPYYMHQMSNDGPPHFPSLPTTDTPISKSETATSSIDLVTDYIKNQSPLAHLLHNEMKETRPSTSPATTTITTVPSLTTDPIFSHYKQPAKPIRGPMYLIIQGHSKVKTYKPSVNRHGVPVENNEIQQAHTERPSKLEQLINENTRSQNIEKSLATRNAEKERPRQKRVEQENLLSLVDSNFSGFTIQPLTAIEEERQSNSVTTIEINN